MGYTHPSGSKATHFEHSQNKWEGAEQPGQGERARAVPRVGMKRIPPLLREKNSRKNLTQELSDRPALTREAWTRALAGSGSVWELQVGEGDSAGRTWMGKLERFGTGHGTASGDGRGGLFPLTSSCFRDSADANFLGRISTLPVPDQRTAPGERRGRELRETYPPDDTHLPRSTGDCPELSN